MGDVPPPGRDVVTNRARSDPDREADRRAAMYNFNVFCQKERKIKPCCKEPLRALSVLHAEVGCWQLLLPGLELLGGFSTKDAEIRAYVAPVQSCWKCSKFSGQPAGRGWGCLGGALCAFFLLFPITVLLSGSVMRSTAPPWQATGLALTFFNCFWLKSELPQRLWEQD